MRGECLDAKSCGALWETEKLILQGLMTTRPRPEAGLEKRMLKIRGTPPRLCLPTVQELGQGLRLSREHRNRQVGRPGLHLEQHDEYTCLLLLTLATRISAGQRTRSYR